jgi:hypothetical protein
MKNTAGLLYAFVLKPFFIADILISILIPIKSIFNKRLSNCLSVSYLTKTMHMDISFKALLKIWSEYTEEARLARFLMKGFVEGLGNFKKGHTYKVEVNESFYDKLKRINERKNFPCSYKVTNEYETKQIIERLVLISPCHYWYYIITAALGNKKSCEKLKKPFEKVKMYKVDLVISKEI